MKKVILILIVAFTTSLSFTSCTEEEVTPSSEITKTNGGNGSDPL